MKNLILFLILPCLLLAEKVCLTMIVKDDAAVIRRCLNSVKDIVDCISIVDLESTDKTLEIIREFALETSIPTKIYTHEWRNFGYNRTLAAVEAQKTLKEFKFDLATTYLLVLDADMICTCGRGFNKAIMKADGYKVPERSDLFGYYRYNLRLLRASLPWESVGEMAEVWLVKKPHACSQLSTLMIEEKGDGGLKVEKQDIKLLTENLKNEPNNAKVIFHLAQLHKTKKEYTPAIEGYLARIEQGGDKEEVWFSKYMLGACYDEMGEWDKALDWYLEAFQDNPSRTESLLKIANHYRIRKKNDLAHLFAKYGSSIPSPGDQTLFDISPQTDYQFDEEISIASFYTRYKDDGYRAASDLVLRKNVPWHVKDQAYKNMLFYVPNLANSRFLPITPDLPFIERGFDERYHPMNPSIVKTNTGYTLICRAVNYTQKGAIPWFFNTIDARGVYRTKNFLIHYDFDFNPLSQSEITEELERQKYISCNVEGLEDCRLVEHNQSLWFTCTTSDTNPTGQRQISLCKLGNGVEELIPLIGPDLHRCEKNWLPFVKDGTLQAVYSSDPFTIFKLNLETGECETVLTYHTDLDFSSFRGSAAPLPFDDGYLMLVHEVVTLPDHARNYLHRFLFLDQNFMVKKASKPFTFQHLGIEFCLSMVIDHAQKQLVMPIGIEDREAYLCFVDLETVRKMLTPLP